MFWGFVLCAYALFGMPVGLLECGYGLPCEAVADINDTTRGLKPRFSPYTRYMLRVHRHEKTRLSHLWFMYWSLWQLGPVLMWGCFVGVVLYVYYVYRFSSTSWGKPRMQLVDASDRYTYTNIFLLFCRARLFSFHTTRPRPSYYQGQPEFVMAVILVRCFPPFCLVAPDVQGWQNPLSHK